MFTVLTFEESLVETKAKDLADSSQMNAWVAPVPLLTINPESKVGVPD
jgi:hypothetical protein